MPRRNVQVDHKGKRRNPLSDMGRAYLLVRIAAPMMPLSHAAHAVAMHGDTILYMNDEELRAAIEATKKAWEMATDKERMDASRRANKWESNPDLRSKLELHQSWALRRVDASLERTVAELARLGYSDLRRVMEWGPNGVVLKKSSDLDDDAAAAVAEVIEVVGKGKGRAVRVKLHSKTEALTALLKYFVPEAVNNTTVNLFNGPNPFTGWTLEELSAWREEHRARLIEGKVVHTTKAAGEGMG